MRISFLTSGHLPNDDRIYWHLGRSLFNCGHQVEIVSSKSGIVRSEGISICSFDGDNLPKKLKFSLFREKLSDFRPDIIFCSEPLPCLAAGSYRRRSGNRVKVIYDITEWTPSAEMLKGIPAVKRLTLAAALFAVDIAASFKVDAFIFGELYKSRKYRRLFPRKPYVNTCYYPDLQYIKYTEPEAPRNELNLVYSGRISISKGIGNFAGVIASLKKKNPGLRINVKVIGWYENEIDTKQCKSFMTWLKDNSVFEIINRLDYKDFIREISDSSLFLDLRKENHENRHSLPVKLFCYMALGRPVIYSDNIAVSNGVEINEFGHLVNPEEHDKIAAIILDYTQNRQLYLANCANARRLSGEKYNWQAIAPEFIRFVESMASSR